MQISHECLADIDRQRQEILPAARFVEDLEAGRPFRAGLRVKGVQGARDVMEMTFAPDGRATWEFGAEVKVGEVHVIWRRIGTHDIFCAP